MGIWQHTHTVTTTEVSPDLGKFTEILDDVRPVLTIVRYGFFFSLAKNVPIFVDFHFPCLTMDTIFFVIYSFYSLHVWELLIDSSRPRVPSYAIWIWRDRGEE